MSEAEMRMSGRLVRDAELRFTSGGKSVCEFVIVHNHRYKSGSSWETEDQGLFMDVVCWGTLAENCGASLFKGDNVVVYGRLKPESWTDSEGRKQNRVKLIADDVGLSLKWNPATAERTERTRVREPEYGNEEAL